MKLVDFYMSLFEQTKTDLAFVERELHRTVLCKDLSNLVLEFLKPDVKEWDPWSWDQNVPEFDSFGNYGSFPMCLTDLPLF